RTDHLRRHTANHDPQRAKSCPECGRSFARGDVLAAHIKKHDFGPVVLPQRSPSPEQYAAEQPVTAPDAVAQTNDLIGDSDFESLYQWLTAGSDFTAADGGGGGGNSFTMDDALDPTWLIDLPTIAGPSRGPIEQNIEVPLDESHQLSLLAYFSAGPFSLATLPDLLSSPSFALPSLSDALARYWLRFDSQAPILHRPTFHPSTSTGLLAAVLTAGLCVSDSGSDRSLGAALYRHLRPLLMLHEVSSWPAPLTAFQALCILGQVGQMLLGQEEHRMSYPFSAFEVTLGRSVDLFSWRFFAKMLSGLQDKRTLEEKWAGWAEVEAWRRIAHCVILRDIQLCSVFQQLPTRALSILFVRLTLPCNDDRWYAPSARAWQALPVTTELPFPHVIKSALSPTSTQGHQNGPVALNPFARYCLVHGLMSVAWDVKWRGTLRATALESVSRNWRASLLAAYRRIRNDVTAALELPFSTASELGMSRTTLDLLLIAELDLLADLTSILTFAGVERIAARNIGPEDFATAGKAARKFALGDDGISAAVVAADYLRTQLDSVSNVAPFFAPWAIYIATLVLWTVTALRPSPPGPASFDGPDLGNPYAVRGFGRLHDLRIVSADFAR
ncbi:hypothetical protein RHOSPDRAFT_16107, partial [Rhodotorula sp. JG-1b]